MDPSTNEPVIAVLDLRARRHELLGLLLELFTESEVKEVIEENTIIQRARPGVEFCRIERYQDPIQWTRVEPTLVVKYRHRFCQLTITDYIDYAVYLEELEKRRLN